MGAASVKGDSLYFRHREEYQRWTGDDVRAAFHRWRSMAADGLAKQPLRLNKRDYREIFTDFTIIRENAFLSLPMEHFDLLASGTPPRVYVYEILYLLALNCNATLDDKVRLAFRMFDANGNGEMSLDEMVLLLQAALSAAFKVKLVETMPTVSRIESVAEEMFASADINVDSRIDELEFCTWARRAVATQVIQKRFARDPERARRASIKSSGTGGSGTGAGAGSTTALPALGRSGRRHSDSNAADLGAISTIAGAAAHFKTMGQAAHEKVSTRKKVRTGGRVSRRRSVGGVVTESEAGDEGVDAGAGKSSRGSRKGTKEPSASRKGDREALPPVPKNHMYQKLLADAMRMEGKSRALQLRTVATSFVIQELVDTTTFTRPELDKLAEAYVRRTGPRNEMGFGEFIKFIGAHTPRLVSDDYLARRVFAVCDRDSNGVIDFMEMCLALNRVMRGNVEQKIGFLFAVLDVDGDGSLEVSELCNVVKKAGEHLNAIIEFAEEALETLDADGDGEITREEFATALVREPGLLEAFSATTMVSPLVLRALNSLRVEFPKFNLDTIVEVATWYQKHDKAALTHPMRAETYIVVMLKWFDIPHAGDGTGARLDAIYKNLQHHGKFILQEALNAFGQVFTHTVNEQVELYFSLFDLDGGGTLDRNEIIHMLLNSQREMDTEAQNVVSMITTIDEDGDGRVTLDEFLRLAVAEPTMLSTLSSLFWVREKTCIVHHKRRDYHGKLDVLGQADRELREADAARHRGKDREGASMSHEAVLEAVAGDEYLSGHLPGLSVTTAAAGSNSGPRSGRRRSSAFALGLDATEGHKPENQTPSSKVAARRRMRSRRRSVEERSTNEEATNKHMTKAEIAIRSGKYRAAREDVREMAAARVSSPARTAALGPDLEELGASLLPSIRAAPAPKPRARHGAHSSQAAKKKTRQLARLRAEDRVAMKLAEHSASMVDDDVEVAETEKPPARAPKSKRGRSFTKRLAKL